MKTMIIFRMTLFSLAVFAQLLFTSSVHANGKKIQIHNERYITYNDDHGDVIKTEKSHQIWIDTIAITSVSETEVTAKCKRKLVTRWDNEELKNKKRCGGHETTYDVYNDVLKRCESELSGKKEVITLNNGARVETCHVKMRGYNGTYHDTFYAEKGQFEIQAIREDFFYVTTGCSPNHCFLHTLRELKL